MKHDPDEFERTRMPEAEEIHRDVKATAGRTPTRLTPVLVRSHHVSIEQHHRDYIRDKLGQKLGKFAPAIERIFVRFDDVNGPKGGNDHVCRIQVTLSGMGVVIVEETNIDPITAFDLAEHRLMHALDHRIGRVRQGQVPAQKRAKSLQRATLPELSPEREPRM